MILGCKSSGEYDYIVTSKPQAFINGGFEFVSESSKPVDWYVTGGKIAIDSVTAYSGKYSCRFTFENDYSVVHTSLRSYKSAALANKNIELRIRMKCDFKDSASIGSVFLQTVTEHESTRLLYGKPFSRTDDWQELSAVMYIDTLYYETIALGIEVRNGSGTVWIDEVQLYADGELFTDTSDAVRTEPLSQIEKEWLEKNTYGICNSKTINDISKAKIIGIGEETHGSYSIRIKRLELAGELIRNANFMIIADEMSDFDCYEVYKSKLKRYKKIAEDENISVNADFLPDRKIKYIGLNVSAERLIKSVRMFTDGRLHKEINKLDEFLAKPLRSVNPGVNGRPFEFTRLERNEIMTIINKLRVWANENLNTRKERDHFFFTTDLLIEMMDYNYAKRDELMFRVVDFLRQKYPEDKIVMFAHNAHISKSTGFLEINAGRMLYEKYGKDYFALASTFNEGNYTAVNNVSGERELIESRPAFAGCYEYNLNALNKHSYFLFLRNIRAIKDENDWLFMKMFFRTVGIGTRENEFTFLDLPENFDGVIFLRESERWPE